MRYLITLALILMTSHVALAQEDTKTKFYDFDDLLINGQYQKPTVLYTDSKKKVQFAKLLTLKKEFLNRLKDTAQDASLR
jgi:hypothetical protein